jgi:hypothetical protein
MRAFRVPGTTNWPNTKDIGQGSLYRDRHGAGSVVFNDPDVGGEIEDLKRFLLRLHYSIGRAIPVEAHTSVRVSQCWSFSVGLLRGFGEPRLLRCTLAEQPGGAVVLR